MVKKPLTVVVKFGGTAKRVGEDSALLWAPVVRPSRPRLSRAAETSMEDRGANRASANAGATGSVVALPTRASVRSVPRDNGDNDATMLALQLCEQVREYRRPQPKGGANVVWLFR
jgi:hypothetical protein